MAKSNKSIEKHYFELSSENYSSNCNKANWEKYNSEVKKKLYECCYKLLVNYNLFGEA